jgi:hypothetical protein
MQPTRKVYEVYKELRDATSFQAVPGEDLRAGREPSKSPTSLSVGRGVRRDRAELGSARACMEWLWLEDNNNVTGNNITARRQEQSARRQEQSRQPPRPRLDPITPEPRDTARNTCELWELLQTAIRSGHVVLVGAEDTWKESCALPGQQVQLRGDSLYKYFASVIAAVAQLTSSLCVRNIFGR